MQIEVWITTAIGLLSALLGYGYREYQNRVRPFFQVFQIDGSLTRRSDSLNVPDALVSELNSSVFIRGIKPISTVGEIDDKNNILSEIKNKWPTMRNIVNSILDSADDIQYIENLQKLLLAVTFEKWIMHLLINKIHVPNVPKDLQIQLPAIEDKAFQGTIRLTYQTEPDIVRKHCERYGNPSLCLQF